MDDRVCACSLPSSVTEVVQHFSTSEGIASSLRISSIQSFPFGNMFATPTLPWVPVGKEKGGKLQAISELWSGLT